MVMAQARTRLSAETWATAALEAIADGGVAAVAVEPLAAQLGTTKGSFYWHFANRDALLARALELWEERYTEAIIRVTEAHEGPAERLRVLFAEVLQHRAGGRRELNLVAAADHPLVGPVVRRVARRRIGYLEELFRGIGFGKAEAGRRALLAYQAYLGYLECLVRLPELAPGGSAGRANLDAMLALLMTRPESST
jgi:AcrR family transcriptional regulator